MTTDPYQTINGRMYYYDLQTGQSLKSFNQSKTKQKKWAQRFFGLYSKFVIMNAF